MGWEQRGASNYYYRKERSGPHVRSIYVGRGDLAVLAAAFDELQKNNHERERMKELREREDFKCLETNVNSLAKLGSALTEAVLIAGGFHQHKRQWRKQKA